MRHARCVRRLSDYVDDALDPVTRAAVEAHLGQCGECRRELSALRRTVQLLGALAVPVDAPVDLAGRIVERVRRGEADPDWLGRVVGRWRQMMDSSWGAPLVTASVGLLLLAVVQGVEIEVTVPGLTPAATAAPELAEATPSPAPMARRRIRALPLAPLAAVGVPVADRRRPSPAVQMMPPLAACVAQPSAPECARWNAWLVGLAMRQPEDFLREVEAVPAGARSRWLGELSRFAASSGSASMLATRLRQSRDPRAQAVAVHFERTAAVSHR